MYLEIKSRKLMQSKPHCCHRFSSSKNIFVTYFQLSSNQDSGLIFISGENTTMQSTYREARPQPINTDGHHPGAGRGMGAINKGEQIMHGSQNIQDKQGSA